MGTKVGENCARIVLKLCQKCAMNLPFSPNAARIEGLQKLGHIFCTFCSEGIFGSRFAGGE
jgi:hypothetical protein